MGKRHAIVVGVLGLVVVLGWIIAQRALDPAQREAEIVSGSGPAGTGVVGGPVAPVAHDRDAAEAAVVREDVVYRPRDVEIFRQTMEWAQGAGLDTVDLGSAIVAIGRRFVGNPYTPHTLDLPGDERVVVNLREFDCVTYVESVLAMARVLQAGTPTFPAFTEELRRIRYRDAELDGYISRLHYFSEWIADNEEKGVVRNVTRELGGQPHTETIDFMSTHADAYRPLDGNPDRIERIREIERQLSRRTRSWIPQRQIGDRVQGIEDGDVIAATSSVDGLDIAHTGFAIWVDGRLHLMHAPLVGKELEISDEPLAVRILGIDGQDGIMVARPL